MLHLFLIKFVSSTTVLSIAFAVALLMFPHSSAPLQTTIITFESLPAAGQIVQTQFADKGIIFEPVLGLDYSQDVPPLPNFARSGTKAIEVCRGVEFCINKLVISFTNLQHRVKLWVGFTGRLERDELVIMRAYDGNNIEVAQGVNFIGPSSGAIPISIPLEATVPAATIKKVTVGFLRAEPSVGTANNNGLAFDDIEFDDPGTAPPCPVTRPPVFEINEPTDSAIVFQNAFTVNAYLSTPDPFATLQINATGQSGVTRTFGPTVPAFVANEPGHVRYLNLSGLLSEGQNTLVFIAKDCAGVTQVTRTIHFRPISRTFIQVKNENDANVQTARIYADGKYIGLTDTEGRLFVTPPLNEGTRLVARKVVAESSTYRDNHAQGSYQDWKYRVYISNMAVNSDGTLGAQPVQYYPDPNAPQVLQVKRRHALIGLHVVVAIEWDASTAEIEAVKQKLIRTSQLLYNTTDGQMFIEQADVVDDKKYWQDADFRIYANQSLRANAGKADFFDDEFFGDTNEINVQILDDAQTYTHEFGHYGFGLDDEYVGDNPGCTALLNDETPGNVFKLGQPRAACIMDNHYSKKLCSHRPENPHKRGTEQGDSSCWSTFSGYYRDSSGRWVLRTPETRGEIPTTINGENLPLDDMTPRLTVENAARPNLCRPILLVAQNSDGTPQVNRQVWLSTTYGRLIFQGTTHRYYGSLVVTGAHVGDILEGTKLEFSHCTPTARHIPGRTARQNSASAVPVAFSQEVEKAQQRLEIGPSPFNIVTTLKPTQGGAQVTVAVEDSARQTVTLAEPPVVKFMMVGVDARPIKLQYDAKAKSYSGTIAKLAAGSEVQIAVEATDRKNQVAQSFSTFQISRLDPRAKTDVISPDGQLTLTLPLPAKGVPPGARISIGSQPAGLPALPDGYVFVSGPYAVWSHPTNKLYQPATIKFEPPREGRESAFANYAKDSLRVFHYDGQKWIDIGGAVHQRSVDFVTAKTTRLGLFALVGQPVPKRNPQSISAVMVYLTRSGLLEHLLTMPSS